MLTLHDILNSQLNAGRDPNDILCDIAYDIGNLLSFASRDANTSFDAYLHLLISAIHEGKFNEQQESNNARTTDTEAP